MFAGVVDEIEALLKAPIAGGEEVVIAVFANRIQCEIQLSDCYFEIGKGSEVGRPAAIPIFDEIEYFLASELVLTEGSVDTPDEVDDEWAHFGRRKIVEDDGKPDV
jgi:hypothetical protein